jgi:hypothetical protein
MGIRILNWREELRNTLRGFATIEFSSGLIIAEVAIHCSFDETSAWAQPPSRPWLHQGALVIDDRGRPKYQPIISFATPDIRRIWSQQVIAAIRADYPKVLSMTPSLIE